MLLWTYVRIFALLEEVEPNGLYIALRSLTISIGMPIIIIMFEAAISSDCLLSCCEIITTAMY